MTEKVKVKFFVGNFSISYKSESDEGNVYAYIRNQITDWELIDKNDYDSLVRDRFTVETILREKGLLNWGESLIYITDIFHNEHKESKQTLSIADLIAEIGIINEKARIEEEKRAEASRRRAQKYKERKELKTKAQYEALKKKFEAQNNNES